MSTHRADPQQVLLSLLSRPQRLHLVQHGVPLVPYDAQLHGRVLRELGAPLGACREAHRPHCLLQVTQGVTSIGLQNQARLWAAAVAWAQQAL